MNNAELPIGLFDSGVGGLTVFKAIGEILPAENLLYLGDTARVPYGIKSQRTIIRYALMATQKLVERGVKMLVVACNTAAAAALPEITSHFAPIPVVGVVEPGASAAVAASSRGFIAVIGTEATIYGNAYQTAIKRLAPNARVVARPCTLFVSLAEEGWTDGDAAEAVIKRYLGDIFGLSGTEVEEKPDTLLLGCTHFPLFQTAIQRIIGESVKIVDSAHATACWVQDRLNWLNLANAANTVGKRHFMTTDNPGRFAHAGSNFLGRIMSQEDVELVDL